jgi:hypothetical protein
MGRRSSFGSRLGAFRNRQLRRELKWGWKNNKTQPTVNSDNDGAMLIGALALGFGMLVCILSILAR